jgi:hypothetical protein
LRQILEEQIDMGKVWDLARAAEKIRREDVEGDI